MHLEPIDSLRVRLILLAALSAVVALGVAGTAFVYNDAQLFNASKQRRLQYFAGLIGLNSQYALVESDHDEAARLLAAMRLDPTIMAALSLRRGGECRGVVLARRVCRFRVSGADQ